MPEQTCWFVCFDSVPIVLTCGASRGMAIEIFLHHRATSRNPDWDSWEVRGYTCKLYRLVPVEGEK